MEELKGYFVIFEYGSSFKMCQIEKETKSKFSYDIGKGTKIDGMVIEKINKKDIIYVCDDFEEANAILSNLESQVSEINVLNKKLNLTVNKLKLKIGLTP